MTEGLIKLTQEMIVVATFNSSLYKLRNDLKTFECPMNSLLCTMYSQIILTLEWQLGVNLKKNSFSLFIPLLTMA